MKFDVYIPDRKLYNLKENEMDIDVFQLKSSDFDTATLPDYRKGAYGISQWFGVELKTVNTKCKFAMVVYQHKKSPNSAMVEIFKKVDGLWDNKNVLIPIAPDLFKRLMLTNPFNGYVVEFRGHAFIKGLRFEDCKSKRPSYDLCKRTNAFDFIKIYGNSLATALAYGDVVHDISEGSEFNDKIYDVQNFVNEMKETGLYACGIRNATERIKDIQEDIVEEDKTTRESYETWQSAVDTLAQYGIEYKREKDEVWP